MTDLDPDIADIVAGALQTSRAHAYELMADAIAVRGGLPTAASLAEECARLCEARVPPLERFQEQRAAGDAARDCAAAIRARFVHSPQEAP